MQALLSPGLPGAAANTNAQEDQEQLLVRVNETKSVGFQELYAHETVSEQKNVSQQLLVDDKHPEC